MAGVLIDSVTIAAIGVALGLVGWGLSRLAGTSDAIAAAAKMTTAEAIRGSGPGSLSS